jgi:hypothetical protein
MMLVFCRDFLHSLRINRIRKEIKKSELELCSIFAYEPKLFLFSLYDMDERLDEPDNP